MIADPAHSDACLAYALWRLETGPLMAWLHEMFGTAPVSRPARYRAWKRYAWPGWWP